MTSWYGQADSLKINRIINCHMTFIIQIRILFDYLIFYLILIQIFILTLLINASFMVNIHH
jgi:hypothetical protein